MEKEQLPSWLARNVCQYMRQDVISRFIFKSGTQKKDGYQRVDRRVEGDDLEAHIFKNQPIGLYVMEPETDGHVRCAVVDLDDKLKKLTWEQLVVEAKKIDEQLQARLLQSWACRSGGGHGIHLWLFWQKPQPANIVRQQLKECLDAADCKVHVDLFPAQDSLNGTLGNLVALPFGRASRPLDLDTGLVTEDLGQFHQTDVAMSAPVIKPVPVFGRLQKVTMSAASWAKGVNLAADANAGGKLDDYGAPDPELLRQAMSFIPNTEYHTWLRVGLGLNNAEAEGLLEENVGFNLWDDWSRSSHNYDLKVIESNWTRTFKPKPGGVGLGTIWWLAKEHGWKPKAEDLDPLAGLPAVVPATPAPKAKVDKSQYTKLDSGKTKEPVLNLNRDISAEVTAMEAEVLASIEEGTDAPIDMMEGQLVKRRLDGTPMDPPTADSQSLPLMGERLGTSAKDPFADEVVADDDLLWQSGGGENEVNAMNKRHFMAMDGGKSCVYREEWDDVMKRRYLARLSVYDFKLYYQNRPVLLRTTRQGKPVYKPLGELWVESPFRRQYRKIVLKPEGARPHEYNMWTGWSLPPSEQGDWGLLRVHIMDNLCQGNQVLYEYVLNWWALLFQKPETPVGVALVMRGARGTGKSSFVRAFGELLGQHFLHVVNSRSIVGQFNSHLRDCALLFADEAVWAGNRAEESVLKGIITEPTLTIEGKGRDATNCRNMIHLVIATNNDWAIPAGMDERRFCVMEVGEQAKQNRDYFRAVQRQLRAGGSARLLWDMLHRDISAFDPGNVPVTKELTKQKLLSLEPWAAWWYEGLCEGRLYPEHEGWDFPVRADLAYHNYVEFCRYSGIRTSPGAPQGLASHLKKACGGRFGKERIRKNGAVCVQGEEPSRVLITLWLLPDLGTCREYFEVLLGDKVNWDAIETRKDVSQVKQIQDEEVLF
jgi:chloramphenicol 3-O-phosphotransferase